MDIFERLYNFGLVPVIKITDKEKAVPLAKALAEGGLNCAEITFRTACAKEAIAEITKALPDMLVGAGTVLTPEQALEAIEAGANVIMPNLSPTSVRSKYAIYSGKASSGAEAVEGIDTLRAELESIGYTINFNRGDYNEHT